MVKKFKNGNIRMQYDKGCHDLDSFMHNDLLWAELSVNEINGYYYIVDYNKSLVYEIDYTWVMRGINVFHENLIKGVKFYPCSKKVSKSLIQDLVNGY